MGALKYWRRETSSQTSTTVNAPDRQYLTFRLQRDVFAIDILRIREILEYQPLTHVPRMPPFIHGVLNLRGAVVPVIDMAWCFAMQPTRPGRRTCIIILELMQQGQRAEMGIIVDEVHTVIDILLSDIEAAPQLGQHLPVDYIAGMARQAGGFIVLLEADKILSLEDMSQLFWLQQHGTDMQPEEAMSTGASHD